MNDPIITGYYQPANVFRQPALVVKKRSQNNDTGSMLNSVSIDTTQHHRKSWKNDVSRIGSPLLRKASDDFNDHYTAKKLKSEYWKLSNKNGASYLPTDLSIVGDTILISNMDSKNNLKLHKLKQSKNGPFSEPTKLHEIQSVSVPGTPIMSSCLLPSKRFSADYFEGHDQLLLCGHQDGVVDLISTSMESGDAKIAKRYKHGKFLKHQKSLQSNLDNWLQSFPSLPVRKIKPWNDTGYTSLVNDSLFIYDLNRAKKPQYLQSFPGIESMAANEFNNPYVLSLCGSQFGNSGVALLDLRTNGLKGNLYIPDCEDIAGESTSCRTKNNTSYDCTWIDEYHVANCVNDIVKIWDIRSTGSQAKCEVLPMKGCIESLNYSIKSKTMYTSDDQGNIMSWDLTRLNNMKKATSAQGFNSISIQDTQELLHDVSQCGNIIINGSSFQKQYSKNTVRGSIFLDTTLDGSLITLDAQELGLHQVCHIECDVTNLNEKNDQVVLSADTYEDANKLQEDSDVTLLGHDLSSLSNQSDCSSSHTLHSIEAYENANVEKNMKHDPHSNIIYSLNDLGLSGSTIYRETI
ncbi:hypothetical protein HG535_0B03320 [Zygotorulaspora mrakii]|uniref:Protein DSE1 n=1 Tax=Zygotorulaspora mrakii TaxID=42260 RepID=A0A7H9AYL5_ZYGMR|nr:uncharacterized protein HG535_0B03320 [Zygotorulaspora mrakii]QLG71293.1 hypothetical protein HG535_0B03320 [Zygotorulaspora mrakii]